MSELERKLLVSCLGAIVALVTCELVLRFLFPFCSLEYFYSKDVGTTLRPNSIQHCSTSEFSTSLEVNALGYRDLPRKKRKAAGQIRLLIIGDSFIEASQVNFEKSLPQQLEKLLSKRFPSNSFEVMSMGISGYGPAQYLWTLEKRGLQYKPDIVIFSVFLGNDFSDSSYSLKPVPENPSANLSKDGQLQLRPPSAGDPKSLNKRSLLRDFRLFGLIRKALRGSWLEAKLSSLGLISQSSLLKIHSDDRYPVEWGIYSTKRTQRWVEAEQIMHRVLKQVTMLSKEHNFRFVLLAHPELATVQGRWKEAFVEKNLPYLPEHWDFSRPEQILRGIAQQEDIPAVFLKPKFERIYQKQNKMTHFKRDGHWNERGHLVAARELEEYLAAGVLAGLD